MLIITILLCAFGFMLMLAKWLPSRRTALLAFALVLMVWLFCESCVYFFFLNEIRNARGENFLIMGNQEFLDRLMKAKIFNAVHKADKEGSSPYRTDGDLGYAPALDYFNENVRQTNHVGIKADKEYSVNPSPFKLRIAAFGDSFVFGDGEKTQDVWPHLLEHSVNNLEVLNFGVSGYGLGQSYLRYLKEGLRYQPDIIFINYIRITERDQFRAHELLTAKRSMTDSAMFRVRFWVEDEKLFSEAMTPLDLFEKDVRQQYIFGPYGLSENNGILSWKIFSVSNIGLLIKKTLLKMKISRGLPEVFEADMDINIRLLEDFLRLASNQGTTVIFFIREHPEDLPETIKQLLFKYRDTALYLNAKFLIPARVHYHKESFDNLMNVTGHFNRRGNEIYAEVLEAVIKSRPWGKEGRRFQYSPTHNSFMNLSLVETARQAAPLK